MNKEMDSKESVNSNDAIHVQSSIRYGWMLNDEQILAEMPVKYVIYLVSVGQQMNQSTPFGAERLKKKPKMKKQKTDIVKLVATDRRIAFISKNGELYADKKRAGMMSRHSPRQFFFYGRDAFENYLEHVSENNSKIISDFKSKNPKFEEYFNEKGMVGKYKNKFTKEGYITSVFFANELVLANEKDYLKGNVGKSKAVKILKALGNVTNAPTWFLDSKKKGIVLNAKELDLFRLETSKAYADRGKNIRARLVGSSLGLLFPTGFFIRINKNQIEDMVTLVDAISGKVVEMEDYTEKGAAKDVVYDKYLRIDKQ